jgi:hypothetical protein
MNSNKTPNRSEVLEREKAFHNRIFEKDYDENERSVVIKYYASTKSSEEFLRNTVGVTALIKKCWNMVASQAIGRSKRLPTAPRLLQA